MKNICCLLTKLQRQMKNGRCSFQPILLKPAISPKEKQQGCLFQKQGPEAKLEPGSAAFICFSSDKQTHFSAEECKALATGSSPGRGVWAVPFHSTLTMQWKKYIHPGTCTRVPITHVHKSMCMHMFFSMFAKLLNLLHFPLGFFLCNPAKADFSELERKYQ